MRFKGTFFLTILLMILGAYLYLVEFPAEEEQRQDTLFERQLYRFSLEEISRLTITGPKGEVEIEYFQGNPTNPWRIFHPVETMADRDSAQTLAETIVSLQSSRMVEATPTELKDFGLDPYRFRVLITINQNDTEILEIGDSNLTGSDVYVRKGLGTSLYLVPAGIIALIDKSVHTWREKEVFPSHYGDIHSIRLESAQGLLEVNRAGEAWALKLTAAGSTEALKARGDFGEIANLLGSVVNLRGDDFIDSKKQMWQQHFGEPMLTMSVKVGVVERKAVFYQEESNPDVIYAMTTPFDPIFILPKKELEWMNKDFNHYRDRRLVTLEFPEQIEFLEVRRPEETYILEKENGQWWLKSEGKKESIKEKQQVLNLLTGLYNLRLETFLSAPSSGEKREVLSLSLKGLAGVPLGNIQLTQGKSDVLSGKSSGQADAFQLNQSILTHIPKLADFVVSVEEVTSQ